MKFAITAILAAAVSAGASFDGLSFLAGPAEMKEAEAVVAAAAQKEKEAADAVLAAAAWAAAGPRWCAACSPSRPRCTHGQCLQ